MRPVGIILLFPLIFSHHSQVSKIEIDSEQTALNEEDMESIYVVSSIRQGTVHVVPINVRIFRSLTHQQVLI